MGNVETIRFVNSREISGFFKYLIYELKTPGKKGIDDTERCHNQCNCIRLR